VLLDGGDGEDDARAPAVERVDVPRGHLGEGVDHGGGSYHILREAMIWIGAVAAVVLLAGIVAFVATRRRASRAGERPRAVPRLVTGAAEDRIRALAQFLDGEVVDGAIRFSRNGVPYAFSMREGDSGLVVSSLDAKIGLRGRFEARSLKATMPEEPMAVGRRLNWEIRGVRVLASDPEWAEGARGRGLLELLEEFKVWASAPFRVQASPAGMMVQVELPLRPGRVAALAGFLDRFIEILRRGQGDTGIRLLEVEVGEGKCPVCLDALTAPQVACDRCRAPHHASCWTYNERCGIFGCGSRTATRG
jgi:hypothetical protein